MFDGIDESVREDEDQDTGDDGNDGIDDHEEQCGAAEVAPILVAAADGDDDVGNQADNRKHEEEEHEEEAPRADDGVGAVWRWRGVHCA